MTTAFQTVLVRIPFAAFSIILTLATHGGVVGQDFERAFRAARSEARPKIEALAKWCHRSNLKGTRDELYKALLLIDPSHRRARSLLRFRKVKRKGWVQSPTYKQPKDKNAELLPELTRRREETLGPFRDEVLALVGAKPAPSPSDKRRALGLVVALHPRSKPVRAALGEAFSSGEWVLEETLTARKRRAQIRSWADECLAKTQAPEASQADALEKSFGVAFHPPIRSQRVRVLSSVSKEEAARVFKLVEAHWPFLEKSLGARPFWVKDFRVFTLPDKGQAKTVFAKHPKATATDRKLVDRVGGMWINSQHLVEYPVIAARRVDGVLRQTVGMSFKYHYGIGSKQAWVWEGLGLHVGYLLNGTRLTSFVKPGTYDRATDAWGKFYDKPESDWLFDAERLLSSRKRPSLASVLTCHANDLTLAQLLYGYALSVYLFEGRPKALTEIMVLVGKKGADPIKTVQKVLDTDLPGLEERLLRWLREMAF